jgi:cytochrome c oxidase subunit 4
MADEWHAAYYIAFGAHGPRAQTPPGEGWKVAGYTVLGVGVSLAVFVAIRMFAKGSPGTMNKEYQEATNEYLKVCFPLFRSSVVIVLSCFWVKREGEG